MNLRESDLFRKLLGGVVGLDLLSVAIPIYTMQLVQFTQRVSQEFFGIDALEVAILIDIVDNEPYDAEKHLILGTSESAETLAKLEYEWYTNDEPHTAAIYASRAVFPYLITGNLRSANKALLIFSTRLSTSNPSLAVQDVSSSSSDARVYPALPLLNFINLLLLTVQRGSADLFKQLTAHYATQIRELGLWDDFLAQIGELYFGIKIPRQGNPLMDMMSNMLFGGQGGQGGQDAGAARRAQRSAKKVEAAPPSSMELD